jgi:hypothetical protein
MNEIMRRDIGVSFLVMVNHMVRSPDAWACSVSKSNPRAMRRIREIAKAADCMSAARALRGEE